MTCFKRLALVLPLVIPGMVGCGGGSTNTKPTKPISYNITVSPSSITVAGGSATAFTALFTPVPPAGGTLTWSINPPQGGTITNSGVYTASGNAGNYTVVATWTPSDPLSGTKTSGTSAVKLLPPPQLGAELNPNLVLASGGIQGSGTIQNAIAVGQLVPSVISTDSAKSLQVRSGFTIPVVCTPSSSSCP